MITLLATALISARVVAGVHGFPTNNGAAIAFTLARAGHDRGQYRRDVSSPSLSAITSQPTTFSSLPPLSASVAPASHSIITSSNQWGNVAALSFTASLAQLMGRTTLVGKLLGAPVTAMALTFALSSISWIPTLASFPPGTPLSKIAVNWKTLLPPGGSAAATALQTISLTLATPLLLLGTSLRGSALRQCGSLLGSFVLASAGTIAGATLAFAFNIKHALLSSLPGNDGIKIAAALLAKNIGGGINYMAVCACLNTTPESIAAGLCVDNVMALVYFPVVSMLSSRYGDVSEENDCGGANEEDDDQDSSPVEALSHAFTLAAVLTALGQLCNSKLHHLSTIFTASATAANNSSPPNLSLPITTLLAVLFATYYPSNIFMSPSSTSTSDKNGARRSNDIAKAGEKLGTSLLFLFFATAGAPGWRLKESIQQSFPAIASFLIVLYGIHGLALWGSKELSGVLCSKTEGDVDDDESKQSFWKKMVAPQRLLIASSAAIGGPATSAALAKSFQWQSLLTPGLLVGNVGYAVATFIGLLFYGVNQ